MKRDEHLIGIHDLPAILEAATKHGFQSRDYQSEPAHPPTGQGVYLVGWPPGTAESLRNPEEQVNQGAGSRVHRTFIWEIIKNARTVFRLTPLPIFGLTVRNVIRSISERIELR